MFRLPHTSRRGHGSQISPTGRLCCSKPCPCRGQRTLDVWVRLCGKVLGRRIPWSSLLLAAFPYAGRFGSHPCASGLTVADHGVRCSSEPLHGDLHRGPAGPRAKLAIWACCECSA